MHEAGLHPCRDDRCCLKTRMAASSQLPEMITRVPGTGGARVLRTLPEELEADPGLATGDGPDLGQGGKSCRTSAPSSGPKNTRR